MNLQTKRQDINQLKVYKWDSIERKLMKINIQVDIKNDNLIYSYQGRILRKVYLQDYKTYPDLYQNMEQIKYFNWQGEYGPNQKKIGKWKAIWNGEVILDGGYYMNGCKQGLWKQPIKNYMSIAQVYEIGEYFDDQKTGTWKYIYNNETIGGGAFNEQAQKNLRWVELSDGFWDGSQITFNGEYKNGKKIGRWDIEYRYDSNNQFILMQKFYIQQLHSGGGSYDQYGDELKQGNWVEITENQGDYSYVNCRGGYQNGKKIGRWDIFWNNNGNQKIIGGGSYDEEGDELKLGYWVEIMDNFEENMQVVKKLVDGIYGQSIYQLIITMKKCKNKVIQFQYFEKWLVISGGGFYDEAGNGFKQGGWVEILEISDDSLVNYSGEYKNGKKVGVWDIKYRYRRGDPYYKMQEYFINSYSTVVVDHMMKKGMNLSMVIGQKFQIIIMILKQCREESIQTEKRLVDGILCMKAIKCKNKIKNVQLCQLIVVGDYMKKKMIALRLDNGLNQTRNFLVASKLPTMVNIKMIEKLEGGILLLGDSQCNSYYVKALIINTISGGGLYDEENDSIKIGQWIELDEGFSGNNQITHHGQYKNGRKVGRWDIFIREQLMQIILSQLLNLFQLLEVVDHMIKKVMELSWVIGQKQWMDFSIPHQQRIMVNIKMVKKLEHGWK
ncbi:unnamed protein product [Paramecium primaurelia]|uniref:Uncharacterized protein n=1 Tax=Paramecium primaurelia TaxID=5886 RepID=A0A8S1NE58_PARPR|nr:unnamed protein product [Paramecium primaurelia]